MNGNRKVSNIVFSGVAIAFVFLMTFFVKINLGYMYINLGDAAIITFSIFMPPASSFAFSALGSSMADIALGYNYYAPITFFVKGLEGLFVSLLSRKTKVEISAFVGGIFMILGYFLAELLILPIFDKNFGLTVAISSMPLNSVQAIAGIIVGYVCARILKKAGIKRI